MKAEGKKGRIFSGARPTGRQHLGNYLGAVKNWIELQDDYECIYCVVDLHALTSFVNTETLKENTYEMVLDWLAAGMRPQETILFIQSSVPQVAELHVLLSMLTPMGWLTRLPTFKEKVRQQPDNVNYGLLGYPVLMAADIALYRADTVPVGEDQVPHLEFTRELVRRFNRNFGETLVEPWEKLSESPRILGLDGVNKMSKTLDNHIELAASPEEILERVMSMVTDPARRYRHDPGHPEVCNVFSLHKIFSSWQVGDIETDCRSADLGCVECKQLFAKNLSDSLAPFRQRREELARDPSYILDVLAEGSERARIIAEETIALVRERMRLPSVGRGNEPA